MAKFCDEFFKETNSDARKRELFVEFAKKLGVKPYSENKNVDVQQQLQVAGLINAVKSDKAKAVAAELALSWKYPNNIYEMRVIVEMMKKNIFDERISAVIDYLHSGYKGQAMLNAAFEIVRADKIRFKGDEPYYKIRKQEYSEL